MYTIVADSGSTKTEWVLVDENSQEVDRLKSIGFNPYFQSSEFIQLEVRKVFEESAVHPEEISRLHFYGSGCSSPTRSQVVVDALENEFPKAEVCVEHDLVGAAKAALGDNDGIAGILGTGSNSCVWVGGKVTENIPSHGYIFGDEGSGSYLGIQLLKLYLEERLDPALVHSFNAQFNLTPQQIFNATYKEKDPNVFLAQFAAFYSPHLEHQALRDIIAEGFRKFFKVRVANYKDYQQHRIGFVGSIAYYYQEILKEVAQEFNMEVGKISQCPIDELVIYHTNPATISSL